MRRKTFGLVSLILSLIVTLIIALEIHKTVAIVIDGQIQTVKLWGFSISDAFVAADIPIYEGDIVTPELNSHLQENEVIFLSRAAWVTIEIGDHQEIIWTAERSLSNLLSLASIQLDPFDELRSGNTPVDISTPLPYQQEYFLQVISSTLVELEIDGSLDKFHTLAETVGDAISDAGYIINPADLLTPSPETQLTGGVIQAIVKRSKEISIFNINKVVNTRVVAQDIGEALTVAGLPLQGLNFSIPSEDTPIPDDGDIRTVHVEEEVVLEQESIPFGLDYIPLSNLDLDKQQIVQVGEYGILARRIRVVYEDGREFTRSIEDTWIAKEPQSRTIGYGTKPNIQTVNTSDGPIQFYRAVDAYATSYSPCRIGVPDKCSNRTASGAELQKGVIGVIRSWYNSMKGSSVYIPGYGFATIEDIGAGFSDRHWVDLGYSDDDWVSWSRYVTVYFLIPAPANLLFILE